MSFSDYKTLSQVQTVFQIKYQELLFVQNVPLDISTQFIDELNFNINQLDAFSSEAARCELIILPILRECYKKIANKCSLWVQKPLNYDQVLNGTPDYMISKRSPLGKTVLDYPLLMIAEAKKNDFNQGWARCLAELIAAQKLNQNQQPIYGIVTDGKYWEFGFLEMEVFTKNTKSYTIDNLEELFAGLNFLFLKIELITK